MSAKEVAIGRRAKAFAGATATGSMSGSATLYGRKALTGKVSGIAASRAGESFLLGFKVSRGKIYMDVGALAAFEVGAGGKAKAEADLKPLAVFAWRSAAGAAWRVRSQAGQSPEELLANPRRVEPALRKRLRGYREMKIRQIAQDRADNYVKTE